ncbi:MAG: discoidin domain-containing protein [Bacteroidaceae bacterium]|nr:discoidin domain-containing protein [Bacteroidaceae bacterium]
MKNKLLLASVCFIMGAGGLSAQQTEQQKEHTVYMVSDAHLDSQWNWDVRTTIDEYVYKTLVQNIWLLEHYPNYVFNFEGAVKYNWMKEYYPLEYEKIKKYIKEGRWHISGSTWDATDTNIPSPESFFKNILLGQEFYKNEFGVKSTDIFLPDCFGFGYTLPTIAAHSGLIGFSTQKLGWRTNPFYENGKREPFPVGIWQGIDGARIFAALAGGSYTGKYNGEDISSNRGLMRSAQESANNTAYRYYGTGDTGGSPTISSVESIEAGLKGEGPLKIVSATSDQLFQKYMPIESQNSLPVYNGELLMDVHGTGCYTSQAAMKMFNRRNEQLGDMAERSSVMADWLGVQTYPASTLTNAWRRFIWHQFHDDLTGTSIPKAYEYSWNDELISQSQFADVVTAASGAIISTMDTRVKGTAVVVYNPLGFKRQDVAEAYVPMKKAPNGVAVYNENGKAVKSQFLGYENGKAHILFEAETEPVSYAVYDVRVAGKDKASKQLSTSKNTIENEVYKITLNADGDISSLIDKRADKELVQSGKAIRLAMFTDNPSRSWPAWEIMKTTLDAEPVSVKENVKISVEENGPLRSALKIEKSFGDSKFVQYLRLFDGALADRIDVVNEVDWNTKNALLKAEFPMSFSNPEAVYDLGIGHLGRGNNTKTAYEVYAQYWADLTSSDNSYGLSILNNNKYGWDKPNDNTVRLTLLHAPKAGGYAYQSEQDLGQHAFTYSMVGHPGALAAPETVEKAECLNQPLVTFIAPSHKGENGKQLSFVKVNNSQVILKSLKKAEDGNSYVLRFYETAGKPTDKVEVEFPVAIESAVEVNGIEEPIKDAVVSGNKLQFTATAFQPKTFSVKLKAPQKQFVKAVSEPLELKYNDRAYTPDAFRREVNFDGRGSSYAAELLPEVITYDGVDFKLGNVGKNHIIRCKGEKIELPQTGKYDKLYLLVASSNSDRKATFKIDDKEYPINVPYYSGFYGQWGHKDHTEGYVKDATVAYVGDHRHNGRLGNESYLFTYMFKIALPITPESKVLELPDNENIVVFAATLSDNSADDIVPAMEMRALPYKTTDIVYKTVIDADIMKDAKIAGTSGAVNDREKAEMAIDGRIRTKWCDNKAENTEKFIEIDLGSNKSFNAWKIVHAGRESEEYTTRDFRIEYRQDGQNAWNILTDVKGNEDAENEELLSQPVSARYVKLIITKGEQKDGNTARIFEFLVGNME